jgi:hypothetical protein
MKKLFIILLIGIASSVYVEALELEPLLLDDNLITMGYLSTFADDDSYYGRKLKLLIVEYKEHGDSPEFQIKLSSIKNGLRKYNREIK